MPIEEIKTQVDALGNAWEEFKSVNDRRLEEIEKKGSADPLTSAHVEKLNVQITEQKTRLDQLEAGSAVGLSGSLDEQKESSDLLEHKQAFNGFLRKGNEAGLDQLEQKALSVGSDPDGGYLVTPEMSSRIIKTIYETSPMRQLASVESISTDSLEFMEDRGEADAGWTSEKGTREETSTPKFSKKSISVHELYACPKATQKLIDDASMNIEGWLAEKVADIFRRKENTAFISGNGNGKPRGILTYNAGTDWGQIEQLSSKSSSGGVLQSDDIIALYYALKEDYATNASFMMNRATVEHVRTLKDANNQYIWLPGLTSASSDTLLGAPVHEAADMPTPATNSLAIACADFKNAYQIVDRIGVRVLRDPFTEKPFVKFYSTKRVGGDVVNFEAIKLLKLDA